MAVQRVNHEAVIHQHGELFVVDPIEARPGDGITWTAPEEADLVIIFPDEPEAGVFLDPETGQPVARLVVARRSGGSVTVSEAPRQAGIKTRKELPYVIYWKNWDHAHSAFFIGGSHPRVIVIW